MNNYVLLRQILVGIFYNIKVISYFGRSLLVYVAARSAVT